MKKPVVYLLYCYPPWAKSHCAPYFVKVGISSNFTGRLTTLKTACPMPISRHEIFDCYDMDEAKKAEQGFLINFPDQNTNGEWLYITKKDEDKFRKIKRWLSERTYFEDDTPC